MNEEIKDEKIETEEEKEDIKDTPQEEEATEEKPQEEENTEEPLEEKEEVETEENPQEVELAELLKRDDVKELLTKVRREEKSKLYDEIEKKDKTIKGLETQISEIQGQVEKMKEDTKTKDITVEEKVEALTKKLELLEKENKQKELDLYKEKALNKAGDELILELVGGNTEEEIDKSIELAKTKYQEVVEKAKAKKPKVDVPKITNPKHTGTPTDLTPEEISKMSAKDWAKYRNDIKKKMGL